MAGRKRKEAKVIKTISSASVEPISIERMVLTIKSGDKFYMKRLRYRGVPTLVLGGATGGEFESPETLKDANRDAVIRELYRLVVQDNGTCSGTALTRINGIVSYFKYLDEHDAQAIPFDFESMKQSVSYFNNLRLKGITPSLATSVRVALAYFLRQMGRDKDARNLPEVKAAIASGKQVAFDTETELKPIAKILIRGHKAFIGHLKDNTIPYIHPFFDESLFNEMVGNKGLTKLCIVNRKTAFKRAIMPSRISLDKALLDIESLRRVIVFNQASRCALQLFFMLTGMNDSVLKSMRRSDVAFKSVGVKKFIFSGIKGRAGYKEIDNALGFSKNTKDLIEGWLSASKVIYDFMGNDDINDQPLIPYINSDLKLIDFTKRGSDPGVINKLIGKLLPVRINATRFRKTKSDILMRVTEDMYLVSLSLNSGLRVVQKTYSGGVKADHDRNVSAAMEAQVSISKGIKIDEAVKDAKVLHSDILSDYDYKERLERKDIPVTTVTPSGVRCQGDESVLSMVERKIKDNEIEMPDDERKCTNFLACFDCDNHLLVASESDIWLMLSFYEQVIEMKDIPAQNSIPKSKLHKIEAVLMRTLSRFKDKASHPYREAKRKLELQGAHPLFANLRGLADTMEVFNV